MCNCAVCIRTDTALRGASDGGNPSGDRFNSSRAADFGPRATGGRGIRDRLEGMTSDEQSTTGPSEETKRKFREALERKNKASKQREGESHLDGGGGAQHTQGPADHKREFRRKSG